MSFPLPGTSKLPVSLERMLLLLILVVGGTKLLLPFLLIPLGQLDQGGSVSSLASIAIIIIAQAVITLAVLHHVVMKPLGVPWGELGLLPLPRGWLVRSLAGGLFCVILAGLVNLIVQMLLGEPISNPQLMTVAPLGFSWTAFIVMLILTGMIAPVIEEIIFRGLLYRWLRERMAVRQAMMLSAVIFAVLHGIPVLIPALAAVGYVLAYLYERSRSLWVPIITHACFNCIMTSVLYAALASDFPLQP